MNPHSHPQGFTRKELLVALAVLFALGFVIFQTKRYMIPTGTRPAVAATSARNIHMMLSTWAQDHDGKFPTARQYSNEAFRELFKAGLLNGGGEKLFAIPGDPWHKNSASGKGPDFIIGTAPDFAQALTRGECAYTYVSGLNTTSPSYLPLLANGFTESLGVYTDDKSRKGGVFRGVTCAYVTVGGSAKVGDLSSDFRLLEKKDGKAIDVFSKEWGTNPDNVKNPEG